jgi:hypothetical protein
VSILRKWFKRLSWPRMNPFPASSDTPFGFQEGLHEARVQKDRRSDGSHRRYCARSFSNR